MIQYGVPIRSPNCFQENHGKQLVEQILLMCSTSKVLTEYIPKFTLSRDVHSNVSQQKYIKNFHPVRQ